MFVSARERRDPAYGTRVGRAPGRCISQTRRAPSAARSSRALCCCRARHPASATILALWRRCRSAAGIDSDRRAARGAGPAPTVVFLARRRWAVVLAARGRRSALISGACFLPRKARDEERGVTESSPSRRCPAAAGGCSRTATRCRRRRCSTSGTCARWRTFRCSRGCAPARVLVIGFGVGNTTHAATLHPSVERVDVADLSRHVLEHAELFQRRQPRRARDPRVASTSTMAASTCRCSRERPTI